MCLNEMGHRSGGLKPWKLEDPSEASTKDRFSCGSDEQTADSVACLHESYVTLLDKEHFIGAIYYRSCAAGMRVFVSKLKWKLENGSLHSSEVLEAREAALMSLEQ